MITAKVKSRLLVILSALLMVITAICGATFIAGADAVTPKSVSQIEFVMKEGASIRLDDNGIRFSATMSEEDYLAINANTAYKSIEYGFFIMPMYYQTKIGELNYENCFGANAKFFTDEADRAEGKYKILGAEGCKIFDNGSEYQVNGSVINMKDQNLATKYVGVLYVKATTNADSVEYKFAKDGAPRSMVEVALRAIDAGQMTEQESELNAYAQRYLTYYAAQNAGAVPSYTYKLDTYLDGELAEQTKFESIALGTAVSTTLPDRVGYVKDEENSILSGRVYADNDTMLIRSYTSKPATAIENQNNFGGELFVFDKEVATDYQVVLPEFEGELSGVSIGYTQIDGWSFANETNTLTIPNAQVSAIVSGEQQIILDVGNSRYDGKVTVADRIITTEEELVALFNTASQITYGQYNVIGSDITYTGAGVVRGSGTQLAGVIDGKGHVIDGFKVNGDIASLASFSSGTVKNLAFTNVSIYNTRSLSSLFSYQAANIKLDNVYISVNSAVGAGGSIFYSLVSGSNQTNSITNTVIVNNTGNETFGILGYSYGAGVDMNYENCYFIGGAPFGTGSVSDNIYKNALSFTYSSIKDAVLSMNGKLPVGFNSCWSLNNGTFRFGSAVIEKVANQIVGTKNNGELFYFSKDLTTHTTDYASTFVADGYYKVALPIDVGQITSVAIGSTAIEGFTYADKVLKIPTTAIQTLANGEAVLYITTAEADYRANVTIADYVITTGTEFNSVLGNNNSTSALGKLIILGNDLYDVTYTESSVFATSNRFRETFDGKGYKVENLTMTGVRSLFWATGPTTVIKNIALINVTHTAPAGNTAIITYQQAGGTIDNVFVSGTTNCPQAVVNGLTANNNTVISNSVFMLETSSQETNTYAFGTTLGTISNAFVVSETLTDMVNNGSTTVSGGGIYATASALWSEIAGQLPSGFDGDVWSIDADGNVKFGNTVVIEAAENNIITNSASSYKILVSEDADQTVLNAASDLQLFLEEATGISFPVVADGEDFSADGRYFSIGNTKVAKEQGVMPTYAEVKSNGYVIKTVNGSIIMNGATSKGISNAVYGYLAQDFGFEYYFPGVYDLDTGVTKKALTDFNVTFVPDIDVMTEASSGALFATEQDRARFGVTAVSDWSLNGEMWNTFHNTLKIAPYSTYGAEHVSWYSNDLSQLCLTAHGNVVEYNLLVELFADTVIAGMVGNAKTEFVISTADNYKYCSCSACAEKIQNYGEYSGVLLSFCNDVAEAVNEYLATPEGSEYDRDFTIYMLAYQETLAVPTGIEVGDNVGVYIAPLDIYYSVGLDVETDDKDRNRTSFDAIEGWRALTDKLAMWIYDVNFKNYFYYYDSLETKQDLYKYMAELGVSMVNDLSQSQNTVSGTAWANVKNYLSIKLHSDTNADVDTLITNFFNACYGNASEEMLAIFNSYRTHADQIKALAGTSAMNKVGHIYGGVWESEYWTKSDVEGWYSAFNSALNLVEEGSTEYKLIASETIAPLYMMISLYGEEYDEATLLAYKNTFKALCDASGVEKYLDSSIDGAISGIYDSWGI